MDPQSFHSVWTLARRQHGVISRAQLLARGFGPDAVKHRVARGRLHPVYRGVYAVGRPELTREGRWMAAVLACGPGAVLSHLSAGALWGIHPHQPGPVHVSVPVNVRRSAPGIVVHRRTALSTITTRHHNIPVTTPIATLIDLATTLKPDRLERAVNEADRLDLCDPETLRAALDASLPRPGIQTLRALLDRHTFRLTDSELERLFLAIVRELGLPLPETRRHVDEFRTDFVWADLGLIVETDGLRYHRTPAQQASDRLRDQAHTAAGRTPLRFTHAQVRYHREHVARTLDAVAQRLREARKAA